MISRKAAMKRCQKIREYRISNPTLTSGEIAELLGIDKRVVYQTLSRLNKESSKAKTPSRLNVKGETASTDCSTLESLVAAKKLLNASGSFENAHKTVENLKLLLDV